MGTHSPPPTHPRACRVVSCLDRDLSRSRVRSRFMTRHESSTGPRVPPIPPITTRRDHPLDGRAPPTDRPRAAVTTTTSPGRHTRARVSYRPQTTRASDVRTEYARTRALSLRRPARRATERAARTSSVSNTMRASLGARGTIARARAVTTVRGRCARRETRGGERMDGNGCARAMARTRWMNVGGERRETTGTRRWRSGTYPTLPARARAERRRTRAWGGGMDACGVERAWEWSCVVVWCASRVRSGWWDGVNGRDARDARSGD